ncbi:trimeric intracellular cation channel family protein [Kozakia baliensis]|nr:hypothetical protein A0U90_09510 [Kozakia baliensis]
MISDHLAGIHAFYMSALPNLDLAGTAVFALSGALVAAKARQTLLTFAFFAAITGVGGGTVRDLLIGAPVFWMHATTPIAVCLIMALLVWFTPRIFWPDRAIDWFDGIGLAAYGVYGAAKALAYGIPWLPAAIMGVVTACMGGIFRDVLAGVPSIVIRPELYVTAAALAAGSYVLLTTCGAPDLFAALVAFALGFGLRGVAIWKGLALPTYRG